MIASSDLWSDAYRTIKDFPFKSGCTVSPISSFHELSCRNVVKIPSIPEIAGGCCGATGPALDEWPGTPTFLLVFSYFFISIGSMAWANRLVNFAIPSAGGCWAARRCSSYFALLSVVRVWLSLELTEP
jgi:hypothetical protein